MTCVFMLSKVSAICALVLSQPTLRAMYISSKKDVKPSTVKKVLSFSHQGVVGFPPPPPSLPVVGSVASPKMSAKKVFIVLMAPLIQSVIGCQIFLTFVHQIFKSFPNSRSLNQVTRPSLMSVNVFLNFFLAFSHSALRLVQMFSKNPSMFHLLQSISF